MTLQLVDSHCHFDEDSFDSDRDAVYQRVRGNGVTAQIVPAVSAALWPKLKAVIPIISALGAGNCLDVTWVRLTRLDKTPGCPLARELHARLRDLGTSLKSPVIYSDEPRHQTLPHQPVSRAIPGRSRAINGTISYMPPLFAMMLTGVIIRQLLAEVLSTSS